MTPDDAVDALMREIPEFAAHWNAYKILVRRDQSDPYIVFGEFGAFLRTVVPQRSLDDATILASFRFLTALGDSDNPEIRDLISAGTFDLLEIRRKRFELRDSCSMDAHWILSRNPSKAGVSTRGIRNTPPT